jgi:hybrid cluster-associated redox disulfide protein
MEYKSMKATKDMLIVDLLQLDEKIASILMGYGMHCIGCMLASNETIEQASRAHGLDADGLINVINQHLEQVASEKEAD